ncbi:MAG: FAD-binding oxidoreductase [Nitrospiraceae bacterium]
MQTFLAEVDRITDLTHDVREVELRLLEPEAIDFQPGQFISFDIVVTGKPRPVTRAYSIASPPSRPRQITLLFNRVDHGPGSSYLFSLNGGDRVHFKGAAGTFRLRDDGTRDLLFVATGTGIAPLRAMIWTKLEQGSPCAITLFWGLRSQRDLYYQQELTDLSKSFSRFRYVTTLSKPEPGWAGSTGRVTELVREQIQSVSNLAVYLCGNGGMIKEVTAVLNAKGLCPIYREKWYDEEPDAG